MICPYVILHDDNLNGIAFGAEQIHVIRGAGGRPVEDIRTKAEHEACAGLITEKVRAFTADQGAALHVSLADGRKTMTYNFFHQRMARIRKRLEEATRCSGYFCAAPKGGPDRGSWVGQLDRHAYRQPVPAPVCCQHRAGQALAKGKAGAVAQREADLPCRFPQPGTFQCQGFVERPHIQIQRAQRLFRQRPRHAPVHKLCRRFAQVHGRDDPASRCQNLRYCFLPRLFLQEGQDRRGI